jgi:2-dehydro-3-deoxygluconokinase
MAACAAPAKTLAFRKMTDSILCFGEVLFRLAAPGHERLLQSNQLNVHIGGAEANVAAALAGWGHTAHILSVLPNSPLAEAAIGELRRVGIDVSRVKRGPGRMGLYFFEQGAMQRASEVIYDRAHSAFANIDSAQFDWPKLLYGIDRLHLSGVTPALGHGPARAAIDAACAARAAGIKVSFDGNFRAKLWQSWDGDAADILHQLMTEADVLFANERDIALVLRKSFAANEPRLAFADAAKAAFAAFPHLQYFVATNRQAPDVMQHSICAWLALRDGQLFETPVCTMHEIVDRIGTGDAFAAGFLHGLHSQYSLQQCLTFAWASGCLKHSIPGDFTRCTIADVEAFLRPDSGAVRR